MTSSALKQVLLGLRGAALLALDVPLGGLPRGASGERERVLIVRLDRIGDFLLWQQAAGAWRRLFPPDRYRLTLLAHPSWADLAGDGGDFDDVWALDVRRLVWSVGYRWRQLSRIRRAGFSTVVQARPGRELLVEDAITRASGAGVRAGLARERTPETALQKIISDRWYTRLVALPSAAPELERNAALMRGLGLDDFQARMPSLPVRAPLPTGLAGVPFYVLFPGASAVGRQWPAERFSVLAERLWARTGWRGVVCGGPEERALGEAVIRGSRALLENWAGRTSLAGLAAIIGGARLVVSNETSAVHMAAAVGTPSLCVLGGGHFGRFVPYPPGLDGRGPAPLPVFTPMACYGCDWHCRYARGPGQPFPCIDNVSLDAVWGSVESLLDGAGRSEAAPEAALNS